jgi:transcriptional regulator with XRE-family HTH domain
MTQAELARKAGIRQHHVSEIEDNRRAHRKVLARRLAAILDCDDRRLL